MSSTDLELPSQATRFETVMIGDGYLQSLVGLFQDPNLVQSCIRFRHFEVLMPKPTEQTSRAEDISFQTATSGCNAEMIEA